MHHLLLKLLICPDCLPQERPLKAHIREIRQGEVHSAALTCRGCRRDFLVDHGIACLLSRKSLDAVSRYEQTPVVSAYLWSHYADLFDDPNHHDAYSAWANLIGSQESGLALDIGCAVGRLTFEMARKVEFAVGIDCSHSFIQTARTLAKEGHISFGLIMEGQLTEHREIHLPAHWPLARADFILADAMAIPFPKEVFTRCSSLNLLDKLSEPFQHLKELNRVMANQRAEALISDPWSWSTEYAPPAAWLGGVPSGPFAGHAHVNVGRIFQKVLAPPWRIMEEGTVQWTIRNHRNHYERIYSDYLLARR